MQTISFHIQMQDELPRAEDFGADAIPAATIRADSMTLKKRSSCTTQATNDQCAMSRRFKLMHRLPLSLQCLLRKYSKTP